MLDNSIVQYPTSGGKLSERATHVSCHEMIRLYLYDFTAEIELRADCHPAPHEEQLTKSAP